MLEGKRVVAVIAARGGSKGLPRKNVLPCGGKPLIAWSIEAARASRLLDRTVVSSDDPEILEIARRFGADVPFVRPTGLATDTATIDEVVLHAVDALDQSVDICVLLQATSPLRRADDIDGALETMRRTSTPSVATVTTPAKSPYWMFALGGDERLERLLPEPPAAAQRQTIPPTYVLNGAVYATETRWLRRKRRWVTEETVGHLMPFERSVDVDTELDLLMADALLRRHAGV